MKLFKVRVNYSKVSEEGTVNAQKVRLFEAVDYTDAQKQALDLVHKNEEFLGEVDLEIQKVSYDCVVYGSNKKALLKDVKVLKEKLKEDVDKYWYEVKVTHIVTNDKDEEKYVTKKYIVEGEDLEDALDTMRNNYLKDEDENNWWFSSIVETPIEDVILLKDTAIQ